MLYVLVQTGRHTKGGQCSMCHAILRDPASLWMIWSSRERKKSAKARHPAASATAGRLDWHLSLAPHQCNIRSIGGVKILIFSRLGLLCLLLSLWECTELFYLAVWKLTRKAYYIKACYVIDHFEHTDHWQ